MPKTKGAKRKAPKTPAKVHPIGTVLPGLEKGSWYISEATPSGAKWKRTDPPSKAPKKTPTKKIVGDFFKDVEKAPRIEAKHFEGIDNVVDDVLDLLEPGSESYEPTEELKFKPMSVGGSVMTVGRVLDTQAFVCGRKDVMRKRGCSVGQVPVMMWPMDTTRAYKDDKFRTSRFDTCCKDPDAAAQMYPAVIGIDDIRNKFGDVPDLEIEDFEEAYLNERNEMMLFSQELSGVHAMVDRAWKRSSSAVGRLKKWHQHEGERYLAEFMHVVQTMTDEISVILQTVSYTEGVILGTAAILPGAMADLPTLPRNTGKVLHYMKAELYYRALQVYKFLQQHVEHFDETEIEKQWRESLGAYGAPIAWVHKRVTRTGWWLESQGFLFMALAAASSAALVAVSAGAVPIETLANLASLSGLQKASEHPANQIFGGLLLSVVMEWVYDAGKKPTAVSDIQKKSFEGLLQLQKIKTAGQDAIVGAAANTLMKGAEAAGYSTAGVTGGASLAAIQVASALPTAMAGVRKILDKTSDFSKETGNLLITTAAKLTPQIIEYTKRVDVVKSILAKSFLVFLNSAGVRYLAASFGSRGSVYDWMFEGSWDLFKKYEATLGGDVQIIRKKFLSMLPKKLMDAADKWFVRWGAGIALVLLLFFSGLYYYRSHPPSSVDDPRRDSLRHDMEVWAPLRSKFFQKNGRVFLPDVDPGAVAELCGDERCVELSSAMKTIRANACTPHEASKKHSLC